MSKSLVVLCFITYNASWLSPWVLVIGNKTVQTEDVSQCYDEARKYPLGFSSAKILECGEAKLWLKTTQCEVPK